MTYNAGGASLEQHARLTDCVRALRKRIELLEEG